MSYSRENPSPRYRQLLSLYRTMHENGSAENNLTASETFSGASLDRHITTIRDLIRQTKSTTLLDYGSGKGNRYQIKPIKLGNETAPSLKDFWGVQKLVCYDPGYGPYSRVPTEVFDMVICTDVMEHIPEEDVGWLLEEQFKLARKCVYGNIASYPAAKMLANGENAHCTIKPFEWWMETIAKAHRDSKSTADYCYLIETKMQIKKLFGLKPKLKAQHHPVTNRDEWTSIKTQDAKLY